MLCSVGKLCAVKQQHGQLGHPAEANPKNAVPDFAGDLRAEVEKTRSEQEHDEVESVVDVSQSSTKKRHGREKRERSLHQ